MRTSSARRRASVTTVLLALLLGSASPPSRAADPVRNWTWPLQPRPVVMARFDGPPVPWAPGHRGVDLAAGQGSQVLAPEQGVVVFVGVVVDREVLTLLHPNGLRSSFEPVSSTATVGQTVARGAVIGRVNGQTHCGTACLHWGVRDGAEYVDPLRFVVRRYAVLLPSYSASASRLRNCSTALVCI